MLVGDVRDRQAVFGARQASNPRGHGDGKALTEAVVGHSGALTGRLIPRGEPAPLVVSLTVILLLAPAPP
jgi:hypothetical protein